MPSDKEPVVIDHLVGKTIDGRYEITARLARGGMASVYIALDHRLDRKVALKVMHPHLAESGQFTARFRREARAAAKISHAGVVPVYDQGITDGQGYLVMELVEGPNLRNLLNTEGPLTLDQALDYTEQILTAISAAHQVGVVHRDLKPENVLRSSQGNLKVVDFGLARAASDVSLSTTGSIMGTVAYMAPEIAQAGVSDERTDIYAVGLMLYEMLVGKVPFATEIPLRVVYARVNEETPSPSSEVEWIPTEIDELVAQLCARNPDERPQGAAEALALVAKVRDCLPKELLQCQAEHKNIVPANVDSSQTVALDVLGKTAVIPVEPKVVHTSGEVSLALDSSTKKTRRTRLLVVVLLLFVAGIVGGFAWWQQYGPGSYKEVPDLVNDSQANAETILAQEGLTYLVESEYSDEVDKGNVIATDPAAGKSIHKNATVTLTISTGVKMVTVPQVVDLSLDNAKTAISSAGLVLGSVTEVWSETVQSGSVVSSSLEAQKSVKHDSTIDLEVSKGREPIVVPNLVGLDADSAKTSVESLGLTPHIIESYSDEIPVGTVISQEQAADSTLYREDSVNYVVSLGPEMIEVPNVTRKQLEEATTILEKAGFEVKVNRIATFFDTVGSQTPAAGELVRVGSVVTVTVV